MVSQGIDPRSRPESVCAVKEIFSDEDKKVMWRYISKQVCYIECLMCGLRADFKVRFLMGMINSYSRGEGDMRTFG